jgi:hypothetical protein
MDATSVPSRLREDREGDRNDQESTGSLRPALTGGRGGRLPETLTPSRTACRVRDRGFARGFVAARNVAEGLPGDEPTQVDRGDSKL